MDNASTSTSPPTKANLKAWWRGFVSADRKKRDAPGRPAGPASSGNETVFGAPLREALRYASVPISTASGPGGKLYIYGYVPIVVAKCGLYLKEHATEIEGTFRVNGSAKRMRELQTQFETPPKYGKKLDWKKENYTTHDVASVFRRYLTQMPESVIPHSSYHKFRDAYAQQPFDEEKVAQTIQALVKELPRANQYLLLYVLDLLAVFAKKSDVNLMTATNLAVIFRPGILSHPSQEMSPEQHQLSQNVLEFLIEHQDRFILDIPPPPRTDSILLPRKKTPAASSQTEQEYYMAPSDSDDDIPPEGGWKVIENKLPGHHLAPTTSNPPSPGASSSGAFAKKGAAVKRSLTVPSRRSRKETDEHKKVVQAAGLVPGAAEPNGGGGGTLSPTTNTKSHDRLSRSSSKKSKSPAAPQPASPSAQA